MQAFSKSDLRKTFLDKRLNTSEADKKSADQQIFRNFFKNVILEPNSIVAGYYPIKAEADILPILHELIKIGHKCLLPHTVELKKPLKFLEWDENTPMRKGIYNIPEPDTQISVIPDVILAPFVAFNENRDRIGYGQGLYDRTIASIKKKKTIFVIGIGYEFQKAEIIPVESTDIGLDMIITDAEVYI